MHTYLYYFQLSLSHCRVASLNSFVMIPKMAPLCCTGYIEHAKNWPICAICRIISGIF